MKYQEKLYKALFDASSEGVLVSDDRGRYVEANPAACSLLGMRRESIIGRFVEDFADPKRHDEVRSSWQRFLDQGQQKGLFRIFRPDGTTRHVHFVSHAHAAPGFNITLLRDITERYQAERRLRDNEDQQRRAVETAEKATRVKSQFFANISHEIRTPINGILGSAELLGQTPLTPEQKEYVAMMNDSGKTLLALVQDLLDFSRVEAGKLKLELQNFDLPTMLDSLVGMMAERARQKRLRLSIKVSRGIARLRFGDPVRLRQVLSNLLGNAVKFTVRGHIRIVVTRIGHGPDVGMLKFSVEDTGPGINRQDQKMLFQPFSQADSSATRSHGGTGLGLAISQQLVELMGGKMGLHSSVGHGSTFWFVLPLRKGLEHAWSGDKPALETAPAFPKQCQIGKLLIVEDNAINRRVIQRQLNKLGYVSVTTANNGHEALKTIQREPFDLVLMDCQMPKMDGYQATKQMRMNPKNDRIPIIAMTAHALDEDHVKCLAAGMDDYLSKPIRLDQLKQTLDRWLLWGARPESLRPKAPQASPIDFDHLSQIVSLKQLKEDPLIVQYFEDTRVCLSKLEKSLKSQSAETVKELAHSALGASRLMGMTSVAEHFARLETLGRQNELTDANHHLVQARLELDRTQEYLMSHS